MFFVGRGWGGRLFEGGHLLTFWAFRLGICLRWVLMQRLAVNRVNTVLMANSIQAYNLFKCSCILVKENVHACKYHLRGVFKPTCSWTRCSRG